MIKKNVEDYIPTAIDALPPYIEKWTQRRKISTFAAKINAFGPTILSMGLKPAAALYSGSDKDNEDRKDVADLTLGLIAQEGEAATLCDYVKDLKGEEARRARAIVLDAIVALKLAVRTFKLKDKENMPGDDGQAGKQAEPPAEGGDQAEAATEATATEGGAPA